MLTIAPRPPPPWPPEGPVDEQRAAQVDRRDPVEFRHVHVGGAHRVLQDAGGVHHGVDPLRARRRRKGLDRRLLRHVESRETCPEFGRDRRAARLVPVGDVHRPAGLREAARGRLADAARPAGDDGHPRHAHAFTP